MTAIAQLPNPCWTLTHADGSPHTIPDPDGYGDPTEPHYSSHQQARHAAAEETARTGATIGVTQLDYRCWTATAACGLVYGADTGDDHEDCQPCLDHILDKAGWVELPDGRRTCGSDDCQTCAALPATSGRADR